MVYIWTLANCCIAIFDVYFSACQKGNIHQYVFQRAEIQKQYRLMFFCFCFFMCRVLRGECAWSIIHWAWKQLTDSSEPPGTLRRYKIIKSDLSLFDYSWPSVRDVIINIQEILISLRSAPPIPFTPRHLQPLSLPPRFPNLSQQQTPICTDWHLTDCYNIKVPHLIPQATGRWRY